MSEALINSEKMIGTVSHELALSLHAIVSTMNTHYGERPLGSVVLALDKDLFGANWCDEPLPLPVRPVLQFDNERVLYSRPVEAEL